MKATNILVGKTIASVEQIAAEHGRTYNFYICLTFTDGTKELIGGVLNPWQPLPPVEEMQKAPLFFTAEDIAAEVLRQENIRRENAKSSLRRKQRDYELLKEELGL